MKFGETFTEYLQAHDERERFLEESSHVEYKRLKKILKKCQLQRKIKYCYSDETEQDEKLGIRGTQQKSKLASCESCDYCDELFFGELTKEASDVIGCFNARVRRFLHLHDSSGLQNYISCLKACFKGDQQSMILKGRMLIDYVAANGIAIRKILKKYDKIHSSINGRKFSIKLLAEHIELLHSPWLIELGAFYLNFSESGFPEPGFYFKQVSCDLDDQPMITLTLSDSVKLDYSMVCPVCLDTLFRPYALSCGHLFCKGCASSAASLTLFDSLKSASPKVRCPVCREDAVYANPVKMSELADLLKKRCHAYWKERKEAERKEMVKQSREHWESQTRIAIGY